MKFKSALVSAAMVVSVAGAPSAFAQATVSNGGYSVGIGPNGELYNATTGVGVGFRNNATGFDPISPGTPRDSWGISTSAGAAYADQAYYGSSGLTTVLASTGPTATALSTTSFGLTVSQAYSFVASNVLRISTTVTNTSAAAISALFQRDVDFDTNAGGFTDSTNAFGTAGANVVATSYNGFENPNPGAGAFGSACSGASCTQTGDNGVGIRLNLGSIAAGASTMFNYYYGISDDPTADSTALTAQAAAVGVTYGLVDYSGSRSAFLGIGPASATPEPGTWGMMILGFGIAGYALRRRRKSTVRISYAA